MQIPSHYVTFDRVTHEALLYVDIQCYWVNMALLVSTDHMYPPSNHRKSSLLLLLLKSISLVQRKCTLLSTHTHTNTPTRARSEDLWLPVPEKTVCILSDTWVRNHDQTQTKWVYLIDHFRRIMQYHFAMRFLIVVKVSGPLSKTIKDQNALNNAPLSLSKLSGSYKGAALLTSLISIMVLKANVPLWWRQQCIDADTFLRGFLLFCSTCLEVKPKPFWGQWWDMGIPKWHLGIQLHKANECTSD